MNRVARRGLPLLGAAWVGQLVLLALIQTSMIPGLAIPGEHFIAREALQCCFMLAMCVVFLLSSATLVITCRAARTEAAAPAADAKADAPMLLAA